MEQAEPSQRAPRVWLAPAQSLPTSEDRPNRERRTRLHREVTPTALWSREAADLNLLSRFQAPQLHADARSEVSAHLEKSFKNSWL